MGGRKLAKTSEFISTNNTLLSSINLLSMSQITIVCLREENEYFVLFDMTE